MEGNRELRRPESTPTSTSAGGRKRHLSGVDLRLVEAFKFHIGLTALDNPMLALDPRHHCAYDGDDVERSSWHGRIQTVLVR